MSKMMDFTKPEPRPVSRVHVVSDKQDVTIWGAHHVVVFNSASQPITVIDLSVPVGIISMPVDEKILLSSTQEHDFKEEMKNAMQRIMNVGERPIPAKGRW